MASASHIGIRQDDDFLAAQAPEHLAPAVKPLTRARGATGRGDADAPQAIDRLFAFGLDHLAHLRQLGQPIELRRLSVEARSPAAPIWCAPLERLPVRADLLRHYDAVKVAVVVLCDNYRCHTFDDVREQVGVPQAQRLHHVMLSAPGEAFH